MNLLTLLLGCLISGLVCGQTFNSSSLPLLLVETNGLSIPNEPKIVADLKIIDNGPGKQNSLTDTPAFTSKIGIEQRGASSRVLFPKKPFGFELRDNTGTKSTSAPILGMPAQEDWVLNATYNDKTLLREVLTYDLYRQMSPFYASRFRYCELFLNGNYEGVYIVFEKIKRDKNRVDMASIRKTDISGDALTGGYLLKIDKTEGSVSKSWLSPYLSSSSKPILVQIDRPKLEDLADEQFQYIKNYVTEFEKTLQGAQFQDPVNGFRKYINEDSFVDMLLISEVCKNVDAYRLSTFFYKDRDSKGGKLTMGPIWDFNLTYGNANYCNGNPYTGWAFDFNRICPTDDYTMPFWWDRLLSAKEFGKKVRLKYQALRQNVLKTERIHAYIDSAATALKEPRQRNFQRWPVIGVYVWPNGYVGPTYDNEVNYLKEWIQQRLLWMDTAILPFGTDVLATQPEAFTFQISPNPSAEDITVRYQLSNPSDVQLNLTDTHGRSWSMGQWTSQPAGSHQQTLNRPLLPPAPGVYFLELSVDGRRSGRQKIVRF